MEKYTFIDLFAWIGAFGLALSLLKQNVFVPVIKALAKNIFEVLKRHYRHLPSHSQE